MCMCVWGGGQMRLLYFVFSDVISSVRVYVCVSACVNVCVSV